MAEINEKNAKLLQYLNEAYGKEQELETALDAHIGMAERDAYKKRLQQHLKETKDHSRQLKRRMKALGGQPAIVETAVGKAMATVKGPVHALRGTGVEEKQLKNAKTEYSEEAEEIATYTAIEALADSVGDRDTAKMARGIRRDEERMAKYLEGLIPQLAKAVARAEIPSDQRSTGTSRRRSSGSRSSSRSSNGSRASSSRSSSKSGSRSSSRSSSSRSKSSGSSRSGSRSSSNGSRSGGSRSGSRRSGSTSRSSS
jgi:ferritin-like metal-binding protein YciE